MNPPPSGWPRATSAIVYQDAGAAIDWLCAAFNFTVRLKVTGDGGRIAHSELAYGDGLVMVAQERGTLEGPSWKARMRSPRSIHGDSTQSVLLYVDDVDAHCARARLHGALIVAEPELHDYGKGYWADRSYGALDLEGHLWWIAQRVRNSPPHSR